MKQEDVNPWNVYEFTMIWIFLCFVLYTLHIHIQIIPSTVIQLNDLILNIRSINAAILSIFLIKNVDDLYDYEKINNLLQFDMNEGWNEVDILRLRSAEETWYFTKHTPSKEHQITEIKSLHHQFCVFFIYFTSPSAILPLV